jgi:hypothetical protein
MIEAYSANSGMIENRVFGYSYCALVCDADTTLLRLRTTGCTFGFSGYSVNFNTGWDEELLRVETAKACVAPSFLEGDYQSMHTIGFQPSICFPCTSLRRLEK